MFYGTKEWRRIRRDVILRDNGCDLGVEDREILDAPIIIHHMNPITKEDIINRSEFLLNPEYLISTMDVTHKALHYGNIDSLIDQNPIIRYKNDTCPWRHN